MNVYLEQLAQIITKEKVWRHPDHEAWKSLVPLVTQDLLNQFALTMDSIEIKDLPMTQRPPKQFERFKQKESLGFRAINDFMAFRVPCTVFEMPTVCYLIHQYIKEQKGTSYEKAAAYSYPALNFVGGEHFQFDNLVTFIYAYLPAKGIIEFQVGHPFALVTFSIDSQIRQQGDLKTSTNGEHSEHGECVECVEERTEYKSHKPCSDQNVETLVDHWNDNTYMKIRHTILKRCNQSKVFSAIGKLYASQGQWIPLSVLKSLQDVL